MNKGDLVPDQLVLGLIDQKLNSPECRYGYIFDGYPRNLAQAKQLDEMLKQRNEQLDKVVEFKVKDETLIERITGRRVHEKSGRSYHVKFNPPKTEGKDDVTGEDLIQRKDDTESVLVNRLKNYHEQTEPILKYYGEQGRVLILNAEQEIKKVKEDLAQGLWDK